MAQWRRAIEEGRPAIVRGLPLGLDDCVRGEVIERLMCNFSVDLARVRRRFALAADAYRADIDRLRSLFDAGAAIMENETLSVTESGMPLLWQVTAAFDARKQPARHASRAA